MGVQAEGLQAEGIRQARVKGASALKKRTHTSFPSKNASMAKLHFLFSVSMLSYIFIYYILNP